MEYIDVETYPIKGRNQASYQMAWLIQQRYRQGFIMPVHWMIMVLLVGERKPASSHDRFIVVRRLRRKSWSWTGAPMMGQIFNVS